MFEFRQYIIAVTTAAIVGCIAISFCDKKGTTSALLNLVVGVIMTITVLRPLIQIKLADVSDYLSQVNTSVLDSVQTGYTWADSETSAIIKKQTEAYILDKASSAGVHLDIEVTVSEQAPFIPTSVLVTGNISPYAKTQLSEIIVSDIGISKENQTWTQ